MSVSVNHMEVKYANKQFRGLPAVSVNLFWKGVRFNRAQEIFPTAQDGNRPTHAVIAGAGVGFIPLRQPASSTSQWSGHFNVTQSVIDQLTARNSSYPIIYNTDPQATDDANVPWLAPGRLLIFIKYSSPIDDTLNITGAIDGVPLLVIQSYCVAVFLSLYCKICRNIRS
jgi:hypothetical protein